MFGIQGVEFLVLAVVALLVLGPDKLPEYAARAARLVRTVRRMAADAQADVRQELGPEFNDISLDDLNPRTFVSRHLFDDDEFSVSRDDFGLVDDDVPPPGAADNGGRHAPPAGSTPRERPPYDDAT